MHTTVFSGSILGVDGLTVEVEVDIARGIPSFSIVGLPNTAVRESRERVTAAIKNTGLEFPLERITVNLAPADIKKEGAAFDLAIAVGIAVTTVLRKTGTCGVLPSLERTLFLGELTLGGGIRKVRGVLPILLHAKRQGFARAVIPHESFAESLAVADIEVFGCRHLRDVLGLVFGDESEAPGTKNGVLHKSSGEVHSIHSLEDEAAANRDGDMRDVFGQESVKRALLVAAAGGHHVLMVGPPGAGKTMLARRFGSILPALDEPSALETTMVYSTAGLLNGTGLVTRSPFRAPHHSASDAGLIGGGNTPRPGEVTLAHNGVLFLDELPEFKRHVLEALREPLEEGRITISRAKSTVTFPARFQLIAAMNPCPCGDAKNRDAVCRCTQVQVDRYVGKISGPLLDRISIHVYVYPVEVSSFKDTGGDSSSDMRREVLDAREIARVRNRVHFRPGETDSCVGATPPPPNARLTEQQIKRFCRLDDPSETLLFNSQRRLHISARGRSHVLRVARTIADLEGAERIAEAHVAEAIQYRLRELPR